ncbi:hypothetical protein BHE74_00037800, partial [Ensete ventricosum]
GVICMPTRDCAASAIDRSSVSMVIRQLSGFAYEAFGEVKSSLGDTRDCMPLGEAESFLEDVRD